MSKDKSSILKENHVPVKERVEEFYAQEIDEIDLSENQIEIDTGNPVGEEIW